MSASKSSVVILAFIIATNIDWLQRVLQLQSITLFQLSSAGLILVFLARALSRRLGRVRPTTVVLLASAILGLVITPALITATDMASAVSLVGNLLRIVVLGAIAVEVRTAKDWNLILHAVVLASALTAASIILMAAYPDFGIDVGGISFQHSEYERIKGAERDPNYAALKMAMAVPFALLLFMKVGRRPMSLVFGGMSCGILAVGIVLTGSRIGLAALVIFICAWFLFMLCSRWGSAAPRAWILLAFVVVGLVLLRPALESTRARMTMFGTTWQDVTTAESGDRWAMSRAGLVKFATHPLIGVGPLEWGFHNSYVDILASYGLAGMCPILLILGNIVGTQWKTMRHKHEADDKGQNYRPMAILLSLLSWIIISITLGAQKELLFWAVMGLGLARWREIDPACIKANSFHQSLRQDRRRVPYLRMSDP